MPQATPLGSITPTVRMVPLYQYGADGNRTFESWWPGGYKPLATAWRSALT